MKSIAIFITGLLLACIIMLLMASNIEGGDINAISMYVVVFFLPIAVLAFLNALYIKAITKAGNKIAKMILSFIPMLLLILLSFMKNLTISSIDGNLSFATTAGAISLGITNLVWLIKILTPKTTV